MATTRESGYGKAVLAELSPLHRSQWHAIPDGYATIYGPRADDAICEFADALEAAEASA